MQNTITKYKLKIISKIYIIIAVQKFEQTKHKISIVSKVKKNRPIRTRIYDLITTLEIILYCSLLFNKALLLNNLNNYLSVMLWTNHTACYVVHFA